MTTKLACSPLTGSIFYGRVNKENTMFVGVKKDMTRDFLECLIVKSEHHGGSFPVAGGGRKWLVTVVEQS